MLANANGEFNVSNVTSPKKRKFKGPRQRSGVWLHYKNYPNRVTVCSHCNANFRNHGSTSTLWAHLKYKHPEIYATTPKVVEEDGDAFAASGLSQLVDDPDPGSEAIMNGGYVMTVTDVAGDADYISEQKYAKVISSRGRTRPQSVIWPFFNKDNPMQVSCKVCGRRMKYHGSTTSMWNHVKAKHPKELEEGTIPTTPYNRPNFDSSMNDSYMDTSMAGPSGVKQEYVTKQEYAKKAGRKPSGYGFKYETSKKKLLDKAITDMIVLDLQPLGIVEEPGFRRFVNTLEPRYTFPTPVQIATKVLPELHRSEVAKLRAELQKVPYVTVTTELWATPVTEGFLTVSVHYLDSEWNRHSSVLETCKITENDSQEKIAEELNRVFQSWGLLGKITCVVIDNSVNVDAAVQILRLPHLPCFAYTMDWIVQESLKNVPEILTVKKKVRDIVSVFHHNEQDMARFLELQKEHGREPKKLKMDVESRWLSTFYMLERYVIVADFIPPMLYNMGKGEMSLTDPELELVKHTVKTLEPFEVAVKEMTFEKHMPLSKVIPMTRAILQFVNRTTEMLGGDSSGLSTELELQMSQHFSGIEQNFLYAASTIMDPRFKKLPFTSAEFLATSEQQLSEEMSLSSDSLSSSTPKQAKVAVERSKSLWFSFDQQVETSISSQSTEHECKTEMVRYHEETLLQRHEKPLLWWGKMSKFLTRISPMAMKYLAIPATAIPADRLFLKDRDIVSQRRSNLKDSVVDPVLFLNKNLSGNVQKAGSS